MPTKCNFDAATVNRIHLPGRIPDISFSVVALCSTKSREILNNLLRGFDDSIGTGKFWRERRPYHALHTYALHPCRKPLWDARIRFANLPTAYVFSPDFCKTFTYP